MIKVSNENRNVILLSSLSIALLLAISSSIVNISSAQSTTSCGTNCQWDGPMGPFPYNWDYSTQTQLSTSNIGNLQLSWVFPLPSAPTTEGAGIAGAQGEVLTPLLIDGIVYTVTNFHLVIAQSAATGKILWEQDIALINASQAFGVQPPVSGGHYHAIWYTSTIRGTPLVWIAPGNNGIYAFNALNGDLNLAFSPQVLNNLTGNYGIYGAGHPWLTIDEKRGILVTGSGGTEGTDSGRGFWEGWNITVSPPTLMWRTFMMPPQDGSDPTWDISSINNASYAWIYEPTNNSVINLKTLPNQTLYNMFYNDWGNDGFNGTHSYGGVGVGWGGTWAVDENSGIAYVGSSEVGPDWNATLRPGPNLWGESVLALNESTGALVWGFKSTSHDLWDFDCSWGVILANATIAGQQKEVVLKGCKNGIFYELDAHTGQIYWAFKAPTEWYTPGTTLLDPTNQTAMTKVNWGGQEPGLGDNSSFIQNPPASGGIESNPAYDPTSGLAFVATYNNAEDFQIQDVNGPGVPYGGYGTSLAALAAPVPGSTNTTIWAVNINTGQPAWNFNITGIGYRGGISATNGIVFVPRNDGYLTMLNAANGQVLENKYIGAALITEPAIGTDSNGNFVLVMPASGGVGTLAYGFLGFPSEPGYLFAMSLTGPSGSSSSASASASATTVTATGPGMTETATVTATASGSSTGVSSTAFYGVAAIAVILLITTAFFAMRRRPAATTPTTTATST